MAGAALRFGHSLIDGTISTVDNNGVSDTYDLSKGFLNHQSLLYEKGMNKQNKNVPETLQSLECNSFVVLLRHYG